MMNLNELLVNLLETPNICLKFLLRHWSIGIYTNKSFITDTNYSKGNNSNVLLD